MRRILPNKLIYLFCWFTAATVVCLYSTGLKAAIVSPTATTSTENSQESILLNLTAIATVPFENGTFYTDRSALNVNADLISNANNLLNAGDLIADKQITCYPNPAISYINFKFEKTVKDNCKLLIYSFTGRKMDELSINGTIIKVSLDDYYRGLYVYQLRDDRGAVLESGKFQVKK